MGKRITREDEIRAASAPAERGGRRAHRVWSMDEVRAEHGVDVRRGESRDSPRTARQFGELSNRDLPESGKVIKGDATVITLVWGGTYDALAAVQPSKGDTYIDYIGYPVQVSELVPRRGGLGQLTITLSDKVEDEGEEASELKDRWEIEWFAVERDLLQHKYIADDADADDIVEDVTIWRNGDSVLKAQYKYIDTDGSTKTLTGKALEVAGKMLRGVEKYEVYAPAVRRVRDYQGRPDTADCGWINTPEVNIAGHDYRKTGDRVMQQGDDIWQRVEEWTGADTWDADLYTEGSGWNSEAEA